MPYIEIEVELDSFSNNDLIDELEGRGYDVSNLSDASDFGIDIDYIAFEFDDCTVFRDKYFDQLIVCPNSKKFC